MEQLYSILTQDSNQAEVNQYIQEQCSNTDFGNILFQILQNDSSDTIPHDDSNFIPRCCFILKQWAKINWSSMTTDQKAEFFDTLKKLILSVQDQYVIYLTAAFTDMTERECQNKKDRNLDIFKCHYDDFFNALSTPQSCSMDQLTGLLNIIAFASHIYKKNRHEFDPSELLAFLAKISENILPYLENHQLLESDEGCTILRLVLESFNIMFLLIKPPIENASGPLSFSEAIENEFTKKIFLNTQLVCACVCFLKSFYTKSCYEDHFGSIIPQILQTHFELLSAALEFKNDKGESDYYLISKILEVIENYEDEISPEQNIIDILLESAKLSPNDIDNFTSNPNLFYYDIYQRTYETNEGNSARISRSIIANFCDDNEEATINLISYFISLPLSENILRCLGICIKKSEGDGKDKKMISLPPDIIPYSLDLIRNPDYHQDPIFISSVLDFIYYLVPHLYEEQNSEIMNELPKYFQEYKDNSVIITMSTRLLKNLIKFGIFPFDNAIIAIIQSLEISFTNHALKCIELLNNIKNEIVNPYLDFVLEGIFTNVDHSLHLIGEEEEEEAEDEDESIFNRKEKEFERLSSNIRFCTKLIKGTGPYLVKPFFVQIVKNIFEYDINCDLVDDVPDLLIAIFGTGTQLIPEFIKLIIDACQNDPWDNHAYSLIQPFFQLITSHPDVFVGLNICSFLAEFCMKMLTDQEFDEPGNYLYFATLLSWIIILDSKNNHEITEDNIQTIYQCGLSICSMEDANIQSVSSFLEILASISVSYNIIPPEEIIGLIINAAKSNWILRICQKQLYIVFFLNLAAAQNEVADSAVLLAFDLMNKMAEQNSMDEQEYFEDNEGYPPELDYLIFKFDFKSPIEEFPIKQMVQTALGICSQEAVEKIQNEFPEVLEQFTDPVQQTE